MACHRKVLLHEELTAVCRGVQCLKERVGHRFPHLDAQSVAPTGSEQLALLEAGAQQPCPLPLHSNAYAVRAFRVPKYFELSRMASTLHGSRRIVRHAPSDDAVIRRAAFALSRPRGAAQILIDRGFDVYRAGADVFYHRLLDQEVSVEHKHLLIPLVEDDASRFEIATWLWERAALRLVEALYPARGRSAAVVAEERHRGLVRMTPQYPDRSRIRLMGARVAGVTWWASAPHRATDDLTYTMDVHRKTYGSFVVTLQSPVGHESVGAVRAALLAYGALHLAVSDAT